MSRQLEFDAMIDDVRGATPEDYVELEKKLADYIRTLEDPKQLIDCLERISGALHENPYVHRTTQREHADTMTDALRSGEHVDSTTLWRSNSSNASLGDIVPSIPNYAFAPQTQQELIRAIQSVPDGRKLDVMSTGLSPNSLFAQNADYLLITSGLNRALDFEGGLYCEDPKEKMYFRTEAGVSIAELLDHIDAAGMSLEWGGYTPQSLIGAVVTATHKSGFFPSIADYVLSADVIVSDGSMLRLEPSGGITNPEAFQEIYPDAELIQDDETFYSSIVLCSVGVIYSVILQAAPQYSLRMTREYYITLDHARDEIAKRLELQLRNPPPQPPNSKHPWQLDLWVLPTTLQTVLVTHYKIPHENIPLLGTEPEDHSLWHCLWNAILNFALHAVWEDAYSSPLLIMAGLEAALRTQGGYDEKLDWRNYLGGSLPALKMMASETTIDVRSPDDVFAALHEIRDNMWREMLLYSAPMGVRFVGKSKHRMSMFKKEGVDQFATIEQPFVPHGRDAQKALRMMDRVLRQSPFGGRPHWGLSNLLEHQPGRIEKDYGEDFKKHVEVRQKLTEGKVDKFRINRYLRNNTGTFPQPDRYYMIRDITRGGYLTVGEENWVELLRRETGFKARTQLFCFTPLEDNRYQIRSVSGHVWTMRSSGVFAKDWYAPQLHPVSKGKATTFKLMESEDHKGAYYLGEGTKDEVLSFINTSYQRWGLRPVRWKKENVNTQLFYIEDAGPVRP